MLRCVLRERPGVRRCLCRCKHCRIFFITDPRNAGRQDLGCPFGCREAHRKQESTRRSAAYYREKEGKIKKRLLNSRRCRLPPPRASEVQAVKEAVKPAQAERPPELRRPWSRPLVDFVRVAAGLIEGRRVSRQEVEQLFEEVLRQHSMARRRRVDHLVAHLHQKPP